MEILREATKYLQTYDFECGNCGTVFRAKQHELWQYVDKISNIKCVCPECANICEGDTTKEVYPDLPF